MSNCPIRCNFGIGANPGDGAVRGRLPLGHTLMNPTETCLPLRKRDCVCFRFAFPNLFNEAL